MICILQIVLSVMFHAPRLFRAACAGSFLNWPARQVPQAAKRLSLAAWQAKAGAQCVYSLRWCDVCYNYNGLKAVASGIELSLRFNHVLGVDSYTVQS